MPNYGTDFDNQGVKNINNITDFREFKYSDTDNDGILTGAELTGLTDTVKDFVDINDTIPTVGSFAVSPATMLGKLEKQIAYFQNAIDPRRLTATDVSVAVTLAANGTITTVANHGLAVGTPVYFEDTVGNVTADTVYYVRTGTVAASTQLRITTASNGIGDLITAGVDTSVMHIVSEMIQKSPTATIAVTGIATNGNITTAVATNLAVGTPVTLDATSGNITTGVTYYIKSTTAPGAGPFLTTLAADVAGTGAAITGKPAEADAAKAFVMTIYPQRVDITDTVVNGTITTTVNHGLAVGTPVVIGNTRGDIVAGTTYYVRTGTVAASTSLTLSASPDGSGAAIAGSLDATNTTLTVVNNYIKSMGHGLTAGLGIRFRSTGGGVSLSTTYYVINPTTDTFQISTSVGGTAVGLSATNAQNTWAIIPTPEEINYAAQLCSIKFNDMMNDCLYLCFKLKRLGDMMDKIDETGPLATSMYPSGN